MKQCVSWVQSVWDDWRGGTVCIEILSVSIEKARGSALE